MQANKIGLIRVARFVLYSPAMRIVVLVLVLLVGRARAQECDPWSDSKPIEIPPQLQLARTCGNGRIDTYATQCEHVRSGGCQTKGRDENVCTKEREVCDGRNLAGNSCAKMGFSGGQLRCSHDCMVYDTTACTLCPKGASCREEHANEYTNLVLATQGEHVRVYWTEEYKSLHVADVDLATGALANRRVMSAQSAIATPVGSSVLALDGTRDKPTFEIVDETGALVHKPAPRSGSLLAVVDQPLAAIYDIEVDPAATRSNVDGAVRQQFKRFVTVVDPTGAEMPPLAMLAHDEYHTMILTPLTPGAHHALWNVYEDDFVAQQGDFLFALRDSLGYSIGVLRAGTAIDPWHGLPKTSRKGSPDVVLDGTTVLAISETEIVALGVHYPLVPAKPQPLLGPFAYRDPRFYKVAQTATVEVHVALSYEALAIAVHKR